MLTPTTVLNIARAEIGYKETPVNRSKYGKWYGMDGQPWCAMFVSWCFDRAGLPIPITTPKGFAYCPYGVNWFRKNKRFFDQPQIGDIVFFDWRRDGVSDHVGIVEAVSSDGTVTTIEGNTSPANNSNGGQVMRRKRSPSTIQGFGRPQYRSSNSANSKEVNVLARTIYGEARGEIREGKIAIASVVLNRVEAAKSKPLWWGNTIESVCLKPYQFSCWNKNDPNRSKLLAVTGSDPVFAECQKIAEGAILGSFKDNTNGATHYYANYIAAPQWAKGRTATAKIGNHLFFRVLN